MLIFFAQTAQVLFYPQTILYTVAFAFDFGSSNWALGSGGLVLFLAVFLAVSLAVSLLYRLSIELS